MPQQSSDNDGISEPPTPSGPDAKHAWHGTNSSMLSHPNPGPNSANGGPPQDYCNPSLCPMSPHLPHPPPHHHLHPGLHPGPGWLVCVCCMLCAVWLLLCFLFFFPSHLPT